MTSHILGDCFASRYEVRQQLGKKAGRRTLLACDRVTGELVVVKLLSFNSDFEWDDLKLFEREAETLKSLSHPSIPRYLDYFQVNSPNFKGFALVQTYIPALSLEKCLQAGRTFTEAQVKQIAKAVLEILIYLHKQNPPVIHRDIKPSNILWSEGFDRSGGEVYLVDFGSVQTVAAQEGKTVTVVGTYGYMPPEQFGGRAVPASDLYSLGATLIYLVTGTHPADLPQKDFRIQFEQVASLSFAFSHWLRWMTEPNLERRLPSAVKALEALEKPQAKHFPALSVTKKPFGSKIMLTKSADALEISIPPSGFKGSTAFMVSFAIAWNSFILFWTINALAAPFPANIPFVLFSLPFWGAGLHMVSLILSPVCERTRLRLDRFSVTLSSEILGWKWRRFPQIPTSEITKLVYKPRTFTVDFQGNRIEVPAQLSLWAGVNEYLIAVGGGVESKLKGPAFVESELEIEWLANELSDWLNIPIQQQ